MTPQELTTDARAILQDTRTPYRYTDTDLLRYVEDGVSTFLRIRPDLRVGYGWRPGQPDIPASLEESGYRPLLAEYVAAKAELRDDQFVENGRVVALLQKVRAGLLTPGV